MEYGATMKQINCIRYFWSLLQADSGHMCFGLEFSFKCSNFLGSDQVCWLHAVNDSSLSLSGCWNNQTESYLMLISLTTFTWTLK